MSRDKTVQMVVRLCVVRDGGIKGLAAGDEVISKRPRCILCTWRLLRQDHAQWKADVSRGLAQSPDEN